MLLKSGHLELSEDLRADVNVDSVTIACFCLSVFNILDYIVYIYILYIVYHNILYMYLYIVYINILESFSILIKVILYDHVYFQVMCALRLKLFLTLELCLYCVVRGPGVESTQAKASGRVKQAC